jgi:hypothetical protein
MMFAIGLTGGGHWTLGRLAIAAIVLFLLNALIQWFKDKD